MATYVRRDDYAQNALGYAVPNVAVTYYLEPGLTLATVYTDSTGDTVATNPQLTDGLGHAVAYMVAGEYTIVYSGSQIQTLTLPDQSVGGAGSGTNVVAFAGVPAGAVNGVNRVFTLTNAGTPLTAEPTQLTVWQNFPLVQGVGFTISGTSIIYTNAPQTTDVLWAQGVTIS
jgi:hypothetical protein